MSASPPAGAEPALEMIGVSAGYGGDPVLKDISMAWYRGDIGALIGPNGSGKSTLLKALTGWLPASQGTVRVFGRDVRTIPRAERARLISLVPQDLTAALPYTVEDVVLMGRTATLSRWTRPDAVERRAAEEAMEWMNVQDLRHRRFQELSGGERQRAAIAMALAREPRLLLLDEPTSHLDVHHAHEILERIEQLHRSRGITVLMTLHDLGLAADFSPRLLLLDGGCLMADGPPESVLREDRLRAVYRCELRIRRDAEDGFWIVRPRRRMGPGPGVPETPPGPSVSSVSRSCQPS